ncbi:MAG: class I SAM-dependent RNA methyltransferase [Treponema sp.]|jgi:putative N6-adenine-specific DNA methylase|nr:class I SAM-dependent RNA methyltransferase [Treponema sp.]
MNKTEAAVALCAVGAEKVVSNELRKLDIKVEDSLYGRVRFKTDIAGLYRALMGLRAADRVLLEIAHFKAEDFDALFEGTGAAAWERIVPKGIGLKVVKVRANRSKLKAETSIQSIVHKAAAQRLCGKYKMNRLPEDGKAAETRVYIEKDMVSLLLDLSGEPLFKRGYRSEGGTAPLRETTAAAILLLSGWKRKFPLYDPFCGSGTILIEAAMYAWDMAPGLGRRYAIEDMLIANGEIGQTVRDDFRSRIDFNRVIRIAGSDDDPRTVSIASSNMARLCDLAEGKTPQRGIRAHDKKQGIINLKALKMKDAIPLFSNQQEASPDNSAHHLERRVSNGIILTNPPYGKRLGDQSQAEQIYKEMGNLKERFPGWKLAVITDHSGFESFYGKKANSCREISNGVIPSYFFQYELL